MYSRSFVWRRCVSRHAGLESLSDLLVDLAVNSFLKLSLSAHISSAENCHGVKVALAAEKRSRISPVDVVYTAATVFVRSIENRTRSEEERFQRQHDLAEGRF